jgi:hypothetical protein
MHKGEPIMHQFIKLVSIFVIWFFSAVTIASPIIINDGDSFAYDPAEEYLFQGVISQANPIISYGVDVDFTESFLFTVTAPDEFSLYATINTAVDTGTSFGGALIASPNSTDTVFAGTSFNFPIDGNVTPGDTQWLSVGIFDQSQFDALDEFYDGSLAVGGFLSGDDSTFFEGGQSVPGNGGGTNVVPLPSTWALLGLGAMFLAWGQRSTNQRSS